MGIPVRKAWDSPALLSQNSERAVAEPSDPSAAPVTDRATAEYGAPVATVNGVDIPRDELLRLLIEMYGMDLLDLRVRLALARQALAARELSLTPADVRAEYERSLVSLALPAGRARPDQIDLSEAEKLLEQVLARNRVGRPQYLMKVELDACLRKLAEPQVTVADDLLPAEFERSYGERVRARHIQLNSLSEVDEVRQRLAAGEPFAEVARRFSRNTATGMNGGLLPPFSRSDDVPLLFKEVAFSQEPGKVSGPISENGVFQILLVEERFPPSGVRMEHVEEELRERARNRLVLERMQEISAALFDGGAVRIHDPALAEQWRRRYPGSRHGR